MLSFLFFFVVVIVRPMASRCRSEHVGMVHEKLRASVRSREWNILLSDFSFFRRFSFFCNVLEVARVCNYFNMCSCSEHVPSVLF